MDKEMRDLEARLENWAYVVREGLVLGHCASAEHRYRPSGPEARELRRAPMRLVDVADGWVVEQAWRELPDRYRWLLKLHFVRSMPRSGVIKWVAKRTGYALKPYHYEAERQAAMRRLKKVLDMPNAATHNSAQQFDPVF